MGELINQDKAKEYWNTIRDPIVQSLIQHAHGLIFTGGSTDFEGKFDLLFSTSSWKLSCAIEKG